MYFFAHSFKIVIEQLLQLEKDCIQDFKALASSLFKVQDSWQAGNMSFSVDFLYSLENDVRYTLLLLNIWITVLVWEEQVGPLQLGLSMYTYVPSLW